MNLLEYFNRTYNLVCLAKLDFFFFFFFCGNAKLDS